MSVYRKIKNPGLLPGFMSNDNSLSYTLEV